MTTSWVIPSHAASPPSTTAWPFSSSLSRREASPQVVTTKLGLDHQAIDSSDNLPSSSGDRGFSTRAGETGTLPPSSPALPPPLPPGVPCLWRINRRGVFRSSFHAWIPVTLLTLPASWLAFALSLPASLQTLSDLGRRRRQQQTDDTTNPPRRPASACDLVTAVVYWRTTNNGRGLHPDTPFSKKFMTVRTKLHSPFLGNFSLKKVLRPYGS